MFHKITCGACTEFIYSCNSAELYYLSNILFINNIPSPPISSAIFEEFCRIPFQCFISGICNNHLKTLNLSTLSCTGIEPFCFKYSCTQLTPRLNMFTYFITFINSCVKFYVRLCLFLYQRILKTK